MGLLSRRSREKVSLFFATDIHGSEICFKKFLGAGDFYGADISILGGDMTGKMVVPVIRTSPSTHEATLAGQKTVVTGEQQLDALEAKIRDGGFYPYRTAPDEIPELERDPQRVEQIFHDEMERTLRRWGELAERKLQGTDRVIYVAPGNDDPFFIDEIIDEIPRFQLVEEQVVTLPGGYEMISTGFSNRTPWDTHREIDEDELREKIDKLAAQVSDIGRAIFNIHVPPYNTPIDEGPDIDSETWDQKTSMGRAMTRPVGSHAVRAALEEHQPLLALHGHIHESRGIVRIGRTLAINPGSDYGDSVLRGCIVLLVDGAVSAHQLTSG
ncbi:MAG: metallophosphoesterase [Actinobacteria bacterium]|nr:metallophosphoesterase [Actinomycetota bacterium]